MKALEGITVVELARLFPGPFAGRVLADFGARVIKVEEPFRGDYSREAPPHYAEDFSVYFTNLNRNKQSVTVDLHNPKGRAVLHRLLSHADVVLESFRPGWMDAQGFGYETLRTRFPGLIYCSVSGFGHDGPYRNQPGHDLNVVGLTGFMRAGGRDPEVLPVQVGDMAGAWAAIGGILIALVARSRTGKGQFVDASMYDAAVSWTTVLMSEVYHQMFAGAPEGDEVGRMAVPFGRSPRYAVYQTHDGRYVTVSLLETRYWQAFCEVTNRLDLLNPNETGADRLSDHGDYRDLWATELNELFASKTQSAWMDLLGDRNIPCFPVYTLREAMEDPQYRHRALSRSVDVAGLGAVPQPGMPFGLSDTPGRIESPPPRLGEHTLAVLGEVGYGEAELNELLGQSIITDGRRPSNQGQ